MVSCERPYSEAFRHVSSDFFDHQTREGAISEAAEQFDNSSRSYEDRVKCALAIQSVVSSTFKFKSLMIGSGTLLSPDSIRSSGSTNCYGNSIVTSELLEEIGVEHYIAFVNQHAFIWLYDYTSCRSHIIDSHPALRCETTKSIEGELPTEWQVGAGPLVADLRLEPNKLLAAVGDLGKRNKAEQSPWLGLNYSTRQFRDNRDRELLLPMRVYPSLPGREILEIYSHSLVHDNNGELEELVDDFENMIGTYPDVDPYNKLHIGRAAINNLFKADNVDGAVAVAGAIDKSLLVSDRTAQRFLFADTLREAAKEKTSVVLLKDALRHYESLTCGGSLRDAKIAKTRRELARLRSGV